MDTWNWYKEMCKLTNPSTICNELRMACIPELNRLLFDLMGADTLNTASEDQLLQYIKLVTVRGLHKEVYWQNFYSMKQKEGELIKYFLARLRARVKFCCLPQQTILWPTCLLYFDPRPGLKMLFQGNTPEGSDTFQQPVIERDRVGGLRLMVWEKVKVPLCQYSHAPEESNLWTAWQLFPLDDD